MGPEMGRHRVATLEMINSQAIPNLNRKLFAEDHRPARISLHSQILVKPREYVLPHVPNIRRTRWSMPLASVDEESRVLLLNVEGSEE